MADLTCTVGRNAFASFGTGALQVAAGRGVRTTAQHFTDDVKLNIQKYDLIDTGNMLGSAAWRPTGPTSAESGVSAESKEGYPYPSIQNSGGAHIPATHFWDEAAIKAEREFPRNVKREIEKL